MIKPHVHVVSQSPRLTGILSHRLSRAGYIVSAGDTEADAVTQVLRRKIQAVICHVRGKGNGTFTLLEQLHEQNSDACVVLVGPDQEPEQVAGLVRSGAFDYLTLPIRPGRLEESLRQALALRQDVPKAWTPGNGLNATNLELARERDTLKRWNQNLTAVNQLSQAVSGTLNADEIVSIASQRLAQFTSYDLVGVSWRHPERIWVQASRRVEPERVAATRSALLALSCSKAAVDPAVTPGSSRRKPACSLPAGRVRFIDFPLLVAEHEHEHGFIRLERDQGNPFSDEDCDFLQAIATPLALALRNAEVYRQVQSLAMTDGLTGLLNRRAFADHLARAVRTAERYRSLACLVMADLDHFKNINDRFGHPTGDTLLKEVASLIVGAVRSVDIVARYGGEEFAMILPHTDLPQARVLAERLRRTLERHIFVLSDEKLRITTSLGLARIPCSGITKPEDWIAAADQALYRAKTGGRNRIVVSEGLEEISQTLSDTLFAVPGQCRGHGEAVLREFHSRGDHLLKGHGPVEF